MVIIVSRRNAAENPGRNLGFNALVWTAAAAATLALSACSHGKKEAANPATGSSQTASAESSGGLVLGSAGPKFASPTDVPKSSPDLNTVPTTVPKPLSTKDEREKVIEGLIADRTNARYTDQTGRTQPVAVRPLVDTPVTGATDLVARIDTPAPARPPEADASATAIPTTEPVVSDIGPRAPGTAPRRGDIASAADGTVAPNQTGFRPLSDFAQASYGRSNLLGTLTMTGGGLTPGDRKVLNTTAREQIDTRGKGVIRVVGHGTGGIDRAILAANELMRLGVAKSNLFVGSDMISGPTEVFLSSGGK